MHGIAQDPELWCPIHALLAFQLRAIVLSFSKLLFLRTKEITKSMNTIWMTGLKYQPHHQAKLICAETSKNLTNTTCKVWLAAYQKITPKVQVEKMGDRKPQSRSWLRKTKFFEVQYCITQKQTTKIITAQNKEGELGRSSNITVCIISQSHLTWFNT
jgi:hypothetical protein